MVKNEFKTFIALNVVQRTLPVLISVLILVSTTVNSKSGIVWWVSNFVCVSEETGEPCVAQTDLSRMTIDHEQFLPNHHHASSSAGMRWQQESVSAIHGESFHREV